MSNPYKVTEMFEGAISEYTGAPYVVAVNSCTNALLLSLAWWRINNGPGTVEIPKRTYVGVAQSVLSADLMINFRNNDWRGGYQLKPTNIWDDARRFTSQMYEEGHMHCVSFHASKVLGIEAGGAILHNDYEADEWFRKARFDGRTEGVSAHDDEFVRGYHCLMNPSTAAQGLLKIHSLPKHNADLPNDDYCDLSTKEIFQ